MKLLIKSLEVQNFHATSHMEVEFSKFNYFYGPNGVGKSTVLQGLQLAILGYIPGYLKTPAAIMQHSLNGKTLDVYAKFVDSDNYDTVVTVRRSWRTKGTSVTKTVEVLPESYTSAFDGLSEVPALDFSQFCTTTANAQKSWFIANLCDNACTHVDLRKELGWENIDRDNIPSDVYAQLDNLLDSASGTAEGCVVLNKQLKTMQSVEKGKLAYVQSMLKSLVQDESSAVQASLTCSDKAIEDLEQQVVSRRQTLQLIEAQNMIAATLSDLLADESILEKSLESRRPDFLEAKEAVIELGATIFDLEAELRDAKAALDIAVAELTHFEKAHPAVAVNVCPYTAEACAVSQSAYDEYQASFADQHDDKSAAVVAAEHNVDLLVSQLSDAEYQRRLINDQISTYLADEDRLNTLHAQLKRYDTSATVQDVSELKETLNSLESQLLDMKSRNQLQALYDHRILEEFKLSNGVDLLASWIKKTGLTGLQSDLTIAPFQRLAEDINLFLSNISDIEFAFDCELGARSFSFGIIRDSQYIPYSCLSAGEQARYCCLLLTYMVGKTAPSAPIIILDDVFDHISEDNFDGTLTWFANAAARAACQVVIAGIQSSNCSGARSLNTTS